MSVARRFGSLFLLTGLLAGPTLAQDRMPPSGSSWTDPPAKGLAVPEPKTAVGSDGQAATAQAPAAPPGSSKSTQEAASSAAAPVSAAAPATTRESRRSALRQGEGRRASSRLGPGSDRPRIADAPSRKPRGADEGRRSTARLAARNAEPVRVERSERRVASRQTARRSTGAATRYARTDFYDDRIRPMAYPRRRLAGWGGLLSGSRADRIAQARSAGFLVMRARTVEFSDGRRMQSLHPLYGDDFDDLD